jgi:hypothetical protein
VPRLVLTDDHLGSGGGSSSFVTVAVEFR